MAFKRTLTIASATVLIGCGFAAQAADPIGNITVTAPRTVHREQVGRTNAGVPIEEVSLTRVVSTAGLDLTKVADVQMLDKRIADTAREACDNLNPLYPPATFPTMSADRDCYKDAM